MQSFHAGFARKFAGRIGVDNFGDYIINTLWDSRFLDGNAGAHILFTMDVVTKIVHANLPAKFTREPSVERLHANMAELLPIVKGHCI